jgi:hypothetical protein
MRYDRRVDEVRCSAISVGRLFIVHRVHRHSSGELQSRDISRFRLRGYGTINSLIATAMYKDRSQYTEPAEPAEPAELS